ncbi:MAG: putative Serine/threonine-protein kinase Nek3 [Streblomastix strix]|uniref:Putative Serine/threonine-protein kinase Nek3 n=1 Tax=Streblomastix strix TaxID=222440 RepID=A0A5J4WGV2_9EUKA|nr:MAG: putative Serine/threonine-protein kinase Nek3 [Streblomastix strix]KAA6394250.1 MAG: putative Serine/threonine-protein kinase Nek3 [Streblomastix strix]
MMNMKLQVITAILMCSKNLNVVKGDHVSLISNYAKGWSKCSKDGKIGYVPTNYIRKITGQTNDSIQNAEPNSNSKQIIIRDNNEDIQSISRARSGSEIKLQSSDSAPLLRSFKNFISTSSYNDFHVIKKLGSGSQGRVYHVMLNSTEEEFAMKKEEYSSDEDKENVNREIEQMKKLESRFIVRLIHVFQEHQDMCLIMEFCSQGDLRKFILELQKKPLKERLMHLSAILSQIIRALDFMHSQGVVLRDIKPENIFVIKDGSVCLGDFGLANEISIQDYATMTGTKVYLAAEVWQSKKTDYAQDIFSVGIVAAELVTGKYPYESGTEQGTIERIKKGQASELPEFVPYEMKELIISMLCHEAKKRPTTKQIMEYETIRMYLWVQEEKEKYQW